MPQEYGEGEEEADKKQITESQKAGTKRGKRGKAEPGSCAGKGSKNFSDSKRRH